MIRAETDNSSVSAVTTTVPVDGLLVLPGVDLFFDIIDSVSAIQSNDSTCHNIIVKKKTNVNYFAEHCS